MFGWLLGVCGMIMLWVVFEFGWIDIVLGFGNVVGLVIGCMMTKLVCVGRSNTSGQTQIMSL